MSLRFRHTLVAALIYVLPVVVQAQITSDLNNFGLNEFGGQTNLGTNVELISTIARTINIILGFLGVLVVVGIVYGGFRRMTAGGNEEQVAQGNKIVVAGVIGLVIILAAYAISAFVITQLASSTGFRGY